MLAAAMPLVVAGCSARASLSVKSPGPVDVQGHRGARGLLPENTLVAVDRALDLGVSTLELDLGATRDRVLVVTHDRRIDPEKCRWADRRALTGAPPLVRDLPLEEIRGFDCGAINPDRSRFPEPPRQNVPGTPIPTLEEVFERVAERGDAAVRFSLELKVHPDLDETIPAEEMVELLVAAIQEAGVVERTTIQCFDWSVLQITKARLPEVTTAALLAPDTLRGPGGGPSPWLAGLDFDAVGGTSLGLLEAASSFVDVFSPYWRQMDPRSRRFLGSSVAELQGAGFPVIPWTVNRRRHMERLLELGVDGIITDYPDRLLELLRKRSIAAL